MNSNQNLIFINDDQVLNTQFFEPISKDLTCSICSGLLVDPVYCCQCETHFCLQCITQWIKKNKKCVVNCSGEFKTKPASRMTKNTMEKVLLKCSYCNDTSITLLDYPSHLEKVCIGKDNLFKKCEFCKQKDDNIKELQGKYDDMTNMYKKALWINEDNQNKLQLSINENKNLSSQNILLSQKVENLNSQYKNCNIFLT